MGHPGGAVHGVDRGPHGLLLHCPLLPPARDQEVPQAADQARLQGGPCHRHAEAGGHDGQVTLIVREDIV